MNWHFFELVLTPKDAICKKIVCNVTGPLLAWYLRHLRRKRSHFFMVTRIWDTKHDLTWIKNIGWPFHILKSIYEVGTQMFSVFAVHFATLYDPSISECSFFYFGFCSACWFSEHSNRNPNHCCLSSCVNGITPSRPYTWSAKSGRAQVISYNFLFFELAWFLLWWSNAWSFLDRCMLFVKWNVENLWLCKSKSSSVFFNFFAFFPFWGRCLNFATFQVQCPQGDTP